MKRIKTALYVEDEAKVRENYILYMQSFIETIYEASNGEEAYEIFKKKTPDLVIIDIEIPKLNGLLLAEKIRKLDNNVPIIILTAHSEKEKLLKAIKLGVTDYLIKPISRSSLKELLAKTVETLVSKEQDSLIYLNQKISININSFLLYQDGELVNLTKYEHKLLEHFWKNKNKVLSKANIYEMIWDDFGQEYSDASIRNLVKKLRKKLPDNCIENIYGEGYFFKLIESL